MDRILPENQDAAAIWNTGATHYDQISAQISDAIEHCVDRAAPMPGDRVLDVATGTGWAARRLNARFAHVSAIDIAPSAIHVARRLDPAAEIDYQVADAESLPFRDASFDVVTSTFGVMFCKNAHRAAAELARVCKPGGRLALALWDRHGGVWDLFRIVRKFQLAAGSDEPSPFAWANEEHLKDLFGNAFTLQIERAISYYRVPSAADAWSAFQTGYGPLRALLGTLSRETTQSLRREFIEYHNRYATPVGILVQRPYLIVVATKRAELAGAVWGRRAGRPA